MKKVKKVLSFLLVFCMILTIMPMGVYATDLEESSAAADDLISEATPTPVPAEDIPADDPVEGEPTPAPTEQPTPKPTEEPAEYGVMATSITMGTKPADGTTTNQPFSSGTGSSTNFRIPALVTLSDGTLVAACDARWNHSSDGYGLDTIVSYSTDSGANWNYTFANYLGDNGNVYNSDSTAFIDPALVVTSDDTIYMLVDLYPHGTYIGNVKAGTGFDDKGHLLLSNNSGSSYGYYVGDFENGSANIYQTNGTQVAGYTVDEYYNITGNNVNTNLFFSDSPYQVLGTSYLYLTKSIDGGKTWSAPQMLNSQVKNSGDMFYGVGPGRGLVTSTGRIMFPCYTYTTQDGNTSVIYSDDNGETWTRSASTANQTSEAALVEADGRIYMFTRHGGYYVSTDNGATWGSKQSVNGISYNTGCQISAITYSKKIDGKTAILLSAPGSTSSRTNGKIFVGLVQDDGSISWNYTYSVTNGSYAYSCLTELNDGSIGLLYESASAAITYTNLAISTIANGAEIGTVATVTDESTDVSVTAVDVTSITVEKKENSGPYTGYTKSVTYSIMLNEGAYTGAADIKIPYDSIFDGCNEFIGSVGSDTFSVTLKDGYFVGTVPHFSNVTISGRAADTTLTEKSIDLYVGQSETVKDTTGNYESGYTGEGLNTNIATVEVTGKDATEASTTYTEASVTCNTLISGDKDNWTAVSSYYYTPDGTNYYPVYAKRSSSSILFWKEYKYTWGYSTTNSTGNVTQIGTQSTYDTSDTPNITVYTQTPTDAVPASTTITFTGVTAGTTSVVVGNTRYNITVKEKPAVIENDLTVAAYSTETISVPLEDGQTVEWSEENPAYAYISSTDGNSATVYGRAEGNTVIIGTVYDADGNVVQTYAWNTTVTSGTAPNSGRYTVTWSYECTIYNGTFYYSVDGGPLQEAIVEASEDGKTITVSATVTNVKYSSIMWFVKPNEGYAVTYVGADANSSAQFYAIDKTTESITIPSSHTGGRPSNFLTTEEEKALYHEAVTLGCDAVFWNSRGSKDSSLSKNNSGSGTYVVHCDKLPTIHKEITSITSNGTTKAYTSGDTISLGDTINYTITVSYYDVTQPSTNDNSITYTDLTLTDALTDGNTNLFSSTSKTVKTASTETYTTSLTVTMANYANVVKDSEIVNTADLSYNYQSKYSTGSYGGSDTAEAAITVKQPEYVVDFGLPVTINLSTELGAATIDSGTARYGTITANGQSFTYTPTQTLKGVEYVTLTLASNAGSYGVTIYPATTVYYEEGFATYEGGWTGGTDKGTENQTASVVGSKALYGYDAQYNNDDDIGPSNGTEAVSSAIGDKATFEFTGTGVEIYTNNTPDSGSVMASIYNAETNAHVKTYIVHTAMQSGNSNATQGQNVTAYNVPIISARDLAYGQYKVVIKHVKSSATDAKIASVSLDGFRVHGTLASGTQAYVDDLEDNPTFIELRDQVLSAVGVKDNGEPSNQYASQIAKNVYSQVYSSAGAKAGAVVIDINSYTDGKNAQDLLDNGPKNELYLRNGQSVVFKVTTNRVVQIGLKALNAPTNYTINNGRQQSLNTSTDMFYKVLDSANNNPEREEVITITNKGTGILSITLVKICDDPNAAFASLTEEDLIPALLSLGFEDKATSTPEPTAEPTIEPTATPEPTAEPTPVVTPTPAPTNPPKPVVPNNPIQDFFNTVRNILNKWFGW